MKILWITNIPLKEMSLNGSAPDGQWMDAMLDSLSCRKDIVLHIATAWNVSDIITINGKRAFYYYVPNDYATRYNPDNPECISAWNNLIETVKPDIIQLWGTEFTHGLCALRTYAAKNIPSVVFIQGVLHEIGRQYYGKMTEKEVNNCISLRDILKRDTIKTQYNNYVSNQSFEKEIISRSGRIICENEWCKKSVKAFVPNVEVYKCPLPINHEYIGKTREQKGIIRHSIMCNASGYPLKGLHFMLRVFAEVCKKYPDAVLYVPGISMIAQKDLISQLRKTGYMKFIEKLCAELNLTDSIVWTGMLSQHDLSELLCRMNAFCLCSALENHSSSLKEAMLVGVPCVASRVGGVPEYAINEKNCLLYNYGDVVTASAAIERLFSDESFAEKIALCAKNDMIKLHEKTDCGSIMMNIYKSIIDRCKQ